MRCEQQTQASDVETRPASDNCAGTRIRWQLVRGRAATIQRLPAQERTRVDTRLLSDRAYRTSKRKRALARSGYETWLSPTLVQPKTRNLFFGRGADARPALIQRVRFIQLYRFADLQAHWPAGNPTFRFIHGCAFPRRKTPFVYLRIRKSTFAKSFVARTRPEYSRH